MAGQAELFTVCSSCGQQVSTFVTECPYCGTRLQKRAPRLDRKDGDLEALLRMPTHEPERTLRQDDADDDDVVVPLKRSRRPLGRRLSRAASSRPRRAPRRTGRPKRSSGYATEGRPWATAVVVLLALVGLPVAELVALDDIVLLDGSPAWHAVTAALTYSSTWNALAVLTTFGVFGWLWERRAGLVGSLAVVAAFLLGGAGGLLADRAVGDALLYYGGGGAAVALATAWIVAELRARRRNESLDGDLAGATVLLVVPVATTAITADGAPLSLGVGALLGAAMGLALSLARK